MSPLRSSHKRRAAVLAGLGVVVLTPAAAGAIDPGLYGGSGSGGGLYGGGGSSAPAMTPSRAVTSGANAYTLKALVSDQAGKATVRDPDLVNAWGLAAGSNTPIWVADNGTGKATLYAGAVGGAAPSKVPLVVKIPGGFPTGQVFNGSSAFGGAPFLLDTESGRIVAWRSGPNAATKVKHKGSVYKGLAISGHRLYAADFGRRRVEVLDGSFHAVKHPGFVDKKLPKSYAPFGIQTVGSSVYVAYAKREASGGDDVPGAGHGFVDVFSTKGKLKHRLVKHGRLNSPWGLAVAPKGFGAFGGALLVGNFGDGAINAYRRSDGKFLGRLRTSSGHALTIPGLWGLRFGNGTFAAKNALVVSAGPGGESHGLLATVTPH